MKKIMKLLMGCVLAAAMIVTAGPATANAMSKKSYATVYKQYAKKLQEKSDHQLYMKVLNFKKPVLLVADYVNNGECLKKNTAMSATVYQYYNKKVRKVSEITTGCSGCYITYGNSCVLCKSDTMAAQNSYSTFKNAKEYRSVVYLIGSKKTEVVKNNKVIKHTKETKISGKKAEQILSGWVKKAKKAVVFSKVK